MNLDNKPFTNANYFFMQESCSQVSLLLGSSQTKSQLASKVINYAQFFINIEHAIELIDLSTLGKLNSRLSK